eukprot:SAG31_NODE_8740_length_1396_cov_1.895914_1_plen_31_part_10
MRVLADRECTAELLTDILDHTIDDHVTSVLQ